MSTLERIYLPPNFFTCFGFLGICNAVQDTLHQSFAQLNSYLQHILAHYLEGNMWLIHEEKTHTHSHTRDQLRGKQVLSTNDRKYPIPLREG